MLRQLALWPHWQWLAVPVAVLIDPAGFSEMPNAAGLADAAALRVNELIAVACSVAPADCFFAAVRSAELAAHFFAAGHFELTAGPGFALARLGLVRVAPAFVAAAVAATASAGAAVAPELVAAVVVDAVAAHVAVVESCRWRPVAVGADSCHWRRGFVLHLVPTRARKIPMQ